MSTHRSRGPHGPLTRRDALAASAVAGASLGVAALLKGGAARALAATAGAAAARA